MKIKVLELSQCKSLLPPRPKDAHKGLFGHVLVVGGNHGKGGAVRLAGEGALRAGAGLVSIATRPENVTAILAGCPELMCHAIATAIDIDQLLTLATVIVIGPGLGLDAWGESLFQKVLQTTLPLVVDADALNLLARKPFTRENWILTPHPGEAARLLGETTTILQKDRLAALQALKEKYQGIIVLKGSGTLIFGSTIPGECQLGNPGMATAGMGDVLSGVIGALVAQDLSLEDAANLAVLVHARAGDLAKEEGLVGMKASDLFPYIRQCLN